LGVRSADRELRTVQWSTDFTTGNGKKEKKKQIHFRRITDVFHHAELKTKVVILAIHRLQQLQQVTFRTKTFAQNAEETRMKEAFAIPSLFNKGYKGFYIEITIPHPPTHK
jgi:5-methylcytosine-specific restriction endonuclease McrBC GTP-binding regulatory subunit McrB